MIKFFKNLIFQCILECCAKMVAWCFTTDEVIHFIMDNPGDGVESYNEEKREMYKTVFE